MDMTPPPSPARQECIVRASKFYVVPPVLVAAVLHVENGKVGQISNNKNGTFDMGPMQINSIHLPALVPYGITKESLINNECLNIFIGTYLIKKGLMSNKNFWFGVGNYHSKTFERNVAYQYAVWNAVKRIQFQFNGLSNNGETVQ